MEKNVLIVDDSAIIRRNVGSALLSDGFDVCGEASDGKEAIELAGKLSPDLIILDLSMPVMSGLEPAPLLRKLIPKTTPIVLYTLYAGKAVEQQLRKIEVDSVISKREQLSKIDGRSSRSARGMTMLMRLHVIVRGRST